MLAEEAAGVAAMLFFLCFLRSQPTSPFRIIFPFKITLSQRCPVGWASPVVSPLHRHSPSSLVTSSPGALLLFSF